MTLKFTPMNGRAQNPSNRPPLASFAELATACRLTEGQLAAKMVQSKRLTGKCPVPALVNRTASGGTRYYNKKEFMLWWREFSKFLNERIKNHES